MTAARLAYMMISVLLLYQVSWFPCVSKFKQFLILNLNKLLQTGYIHGSSDLLSSIFPPISPLLDSVTLNLTATIKKLLPFDNLDTYPQLQSSVAKYNSYTKETRPKCCRPDQFPDLFSFFRDFFVAFEQLVIEDMPLVCEFLQFVTPINCKEDLTQQSNNSLQLGCILDAILGNLFGEVAKFAVS